MREPKLLMLDEPSLGLAPAIVEALYATLAEPHRLGMTLLIAERAVSLALEITDYGYVLQTGRTVLEGTAAFLADNQQARQAHLGVSGSSALAY